MSIVGKESMGKLTPSKEYDGSLEPSVQRAWESVYALKEKKSASLLLAIKIGNAVIDRHVTIRAQSGDQCLAKHTTKYSGMDVGDRTARD